MLPVRDYKLGTIVLHDHTDITSQLTVFAGFKGYFGTPAELPLPGALGYFAIVGSTDTMWVWDMDALPAPAWKDSGAGAGVLAFGPVGFPRLGVVTPQAGDYAANQITNGSRIAGTYVSDALNNLQTRYRTWTIGVTGSGADYETDGTADDVQFTSAIAAATAGDTIKVLDGTYVFAAGVALNKTLTIEGVDRTRAMILPYRDGGNVSATFSLFTVTGAGAVLSKLKCYTLSYQNGAATPLVYITSGATGAQVKDCWIAGGYTYISLSIDGPERVEVLRNIIDGSANMPCAIEIGYVRYLVVAQNNIGVATAVSYGIKSKANNGAMDTCLIEDNDIIAYTGIYLGATATHDIRIVNNRINAGPCIDLNNTHIAATVSGVLISNNVCTASGTANAIALKGITDCTISGNKFQTVTGDYITLANNSDNTTGTAYVLITNNTGVGPPSGGVTETGLADYNILQANSRFGTATLIGANSINRDTAYASSTVISTKLRTWTIGTAGSGADYETDGTADDVQFAAAIAAMTAGDTLQVLPGTYTFSATLTIDKSITMTGLDRALCIIQPSAAGQFITVNVTAARVTLRHLKFTNTIQNNVGNYPLVQFDLTCTDSQVTDCWFRSEYGYTGVHIYRAYYITVERNLFGQINSSTALAVNLGSHCVIRQNVFEVATGLTISGDGMYDSLIADNAFACYNCIISSCAVFSRTKIVDNSFAATVGPAISIDNSHGSLTNCFGISIVGNSFTGYSTITPVGIELRGVVNSSVTGNIFTNFATNNITLQNGSGGVGCSNILVSGNNGDGVAAGSVIENGLTDYTTLHANSKLGTATLTGAHSVNMDIGSYVDLSTNQNVGGIKTFTDVTDASDKDTGSMVLQGGLAVEKKIYAGDSIYAYRSTAYQPVASIRTLASALADDANGVLGERGYYAGYVYECIVGGTGGAGRWARHAVETSWVI